MTLTDCYALQTPLFLGTLTPLFRPVCVMDNLSGNGSFTYVAHTHIIRIHNTVWIRKKGLETEKRT